MRCDCCDVILTTLETRLKSKTSGEYLNTCLKCLKHIPEIKVQYPKDDVEEDPDIDSDDNDYFVYDWELDDEEDR